MVHELTHVWQADHSAWTPSFIFRSIFAQLGGTRRAYGYRLGEPWSRYNVEQQASIVEDWLARGMSESDPRFPYIRDYIREGRTR
jgi:hypothetical protein